MVHASQSDPVVLLSAPHASGIVRQLDQVKTLTPQEMLRKEEVMTAAALDSITSEFSVRGFTGASRAEVMRALLAEHPKEDPFYCVDLRWVAEKYAEWKENLPRVRPFMAVKCMPDRAIMTLLHRLGAGFDCASKGEIEVVQSLGAEPENILYANPCKMASHLRAAKERGVRLMTFDNEAELVKIAAEHPTAQLVLRIVTDDSNSICRFSNKFGAELREAPGLIRKALELGLELVGVSFHVGSGCQDTDTFVDSLNRARWVFNQMEDLGVTPWLLDIGGGFPGTDGFKVKFPEIAAVIRPVIDELFPPHVSVMSEPGRYFCAGSHTLAANMYARREIKLPSEKGEAVVAADDSASAHATNPLDSSGETTSSHTSEQATVANSTAGYKYYLNDGVYGSFNCIFFDHAVISEYTVIPKDGSRDTALRPKYKSTVFGPTCDGLDCILKDVTLPLIECGEWVLFHNMGAYTRAASSNFNGFHQHTIYYVRT